MSKTATATAVWQDRAIASIVRNKLFETIPYISGEGLREWLRARRFPHPSTPNAYGNLVKEATRLGLLKRTKRTVPTEKNPQRPLYTVVPLKAA